MRWFPAEKCAQPRVLALVVVDGLVSDPRKLTNVVLHSGNLLVDENFSKIIKFFLKFQNFSKEFKILTKFLLKTFKNKPNF